MTTAVEYLAQARLAADDAEADRLAVAAILEDPDLAEAYALRGELAARTGDAVNAAHHYRVAFVRGDHSPETRAALATFLDATGFEEVGSGIRGDAVLPKRLGQLDALARQVGSAIRGMLALPLPEAGEPALLPGERRVSGVIPGVEARVHPAYEGPEAVSLPPRDRNTLAPEEPASGRRVEPPVEVPEEPLWVERHHSRRGAAMAPSPRADWLDDSLVPMQEAEDGPRIVPSVLDLVMDPGPATLLIRSPVTGELLEPQGVASVRPPPVEPAPTSGVRSLPPRSSASWSTSAASPPVEAPQPAVVQTPSPPAGALAAAGAFGDIPLALRLALELPGPAITAAGAKPQQLCAVVAFGLTAEEMLLRDRRIPNAPVVRLGLHALRRMDLLRGGAQLSFALADGRQLHLDLRVLTADTPDLARLLVTELATLLGSLGAQVNA